MSRILKSSSFILVSTVVALGCGAEPPTDLEACEHLAEGPASSVSAVASGEPPLISDDHRRYDVSLIAIAGGNGGAVALQSEEAGDFAFFLSENVPFTLFGGAGSAVEFEVSETDGFSCPEIGVRHVAHLEVGTYRLELGPTASGSVSIVVEHAGGHAE